MSREFKLVGMVIIAAISSWGKEYTDMEEMILFCLLVLVLIYLELPK